MTISARMMDFRKRMGWTQWQLAAALHTSQDTISRIEIGNFKRTSGPLFALFDALEARMASERTVETAEVQK